LTGRRDLRGLANSAGHQVSKNRNFKRKNNIILRIKKYYSIFRKIKKNIFIDTRVACRVSRNPEILAAYLYVKNIQNVQK
jgi:hypothetical protein